MAPAGRRHAREVRGLPLRLLDVDHRVEAGEPQAGRDRKHHGHDPTEAPWQAAETPDEDENGRRNAEVDEIGEAVELGAELRLGAQRPRQPAVDTVEQRGDDNERDRILVAQLDGHADRGQPGAEAEQREEVRHQHAHGDAAVAKQDPAPPAALALLQPRQHMVHGMSSPFLRPRRYCTRASRSGSVDLRSASTVSPPTARWPTATNAPWPGGR